MMKIHDHPCNRCPTAINKRKGILDPETEEIKTYPKELIVKEFLFSCAWRPEKLCKGNCDEMGITQEFIDSL